MVLVGRTHGAPYRGYGYVPLRFGGWGGGGTSLGAWEHNKIYDDDNNTSSNYFYYYYLYCYINNSNHN